MIRFEIDIDRNFQRTVACRDGDIDVTPEPLASRHATDFDGVQISDNGSWFQDPHLEALMAAAETITSDDYDGTIARRLEEYLFQGLIGDELLSKMIACADTIDPKRHIEVALRIEHVNEDEDAMSLRALHGLPWELTCAEMEVGPNRLVTLTRLVAPAKPSSPAQMSWPPKILFVLSNSLTDAELQPAREAIGLLSHFELADGEDLTKALRPEVYSHVLENARLKSLAETVAEFQPDVVYFICHGHPGRLVFQDLKNPDASEQPTAMELLRALVQNDRTPPFVVLAACSSANVVDGSRTSGSLAADLVAGGIPFVIGMAGKVTSDGCRMFTSALGKALYNQTSKTLVNHVCYARAVAREFQDSEEPPEWALPTTYLADTLETAAYVPFDPVAIERRDRWKARIEDMGFKAAPVFCCREDLALLYRSVSQGRGASVVFALGEAEHGKSRALKEIGVWALRDGHIPFPVIPANKKWNGPTSARELGLRLLDAIDTVATKLLQHDAFAGRLLRLLSPSTTALTGVPKAIDRTEYFDLKEAAEQENRELDHVRVRYAFGRDALHLRDELLMAYPTDFDEHSRCILLLDDGERYLPELERVLMPSAGASGANGFVDGSDERLPVFIAANLTESDLEDFDRQTWVELISLPAFPKGIRSQLAYERVLLHPFHTRISSKPLCFTKHEPDRVRFWRGELHEDLQGIPGMLSPNGVFSWSVQKMTRANLLIEADDEARLTEFRQRFNEE